MAFPGRKKMRLFLFVMTEVIVVWGGASPFPTQQPSCVHACAHTCAHTHTSSLTVVECLLKPQSFHWRGALVMRPEGRSLSQDLSPGPVVGA